MPDRSVGRTAHLHLTGVSLAVINETGQVGDAVVSSPLCADGDGSCVGVDAAQGSVVLPSQLAGAQLLVGSQLEGDHADGVAVGVGVCDGLMAQDAAAARLVIDGQGHTQILAHCLAECAQAGVRAAACRPGADDRDALGGVIGGLAASGAGSSGTCSRSSSAIGRAAAGGQDASSTHDSRSCEEVTTRDLFHFLLPPIHVAFIRFMAVPCFAHSTIPSANGLAFRYYDSAYFSIPQLDSSTNFQRNVCTK